MAITSETLLSHTIFELHAEKRILPQLGADFATACCRIQKVPQIPCLATPAVAASQCQLANELKKIYL